jgi:predicted dehydrogenase
MGSAAKVRDCMKICIIGGSGHINYVFEGIKHIKDAYITAVAPGPSGEDITSLENAVSREGYSFMRYSDHNEMLKKERPDIAVVSCYFSDHAAVSANCLEAGVHVFSEKPLATDMVDLKKLKKTAADAGKSIGAMFGIRYTPHFMTAKRLVDEGMIGEVRLMHAQKSYKLGTRPENFKNRAKYGGTIPWVGSHAIDWLYWFGNQRFISVSAFHSSMYNKDHNDLEVSAVCQFKFSNEVYGSVDIDYLRPQSAVTHGDDRLRIVGTQGIIEIRDTKVFLINETNSGKEPVTLDEAQHVFCEFISCIDRYAYGNDLFEDAFIGTEACLLARLSADSETTVYFE